MHTANTQHNCDHFHYIHDYNHNNDKEEGRSSSKKERQDTAAKKEQLKEYYSKMSFDTTQKLRSAWTMEMG